MHPHRVRADSRHMATDRVGRCWMEKFQRHQLPQLPQSLSCISPEPPSFWDSFGMAVLHGEPPNGRGYKIPWDLGDTDSYPHPTRYLHSSRVPPVSSAPAGEMARALILQPAFYWDHRWLLAWQSLGVPVPQQESWCAGTAWNSTHFPGKPRFLPLRILCTLPKSEGMSWVWSWGWVGMKSKHHHKGTRESSSPAPSPPHTQTLSCFKP